MIRALSRIAWPVSAQITPASAQLSSGLWPLQTFLRINLGYWRRGWARRMRQKVKTTNNSNGLSLLPACPVPSSCEENPIRVFEHDQLILAQNVTISSLGEKPQFKPKTWQDTSVLFGFIMLIFCAKILNKSDVSLNNRNFWLYWILFHRKFTAARISLYWLNIVVHCWQWCRGWQ